MNLKKQFNHFPPVVWLAEWGYRHYCLLVDEALADFDLKASKSFWSHQDSTHQNPSQSQ